MNRDIRITMYRVGFTHTRFEFSYGDARTYVRHVIEGRTYELDDPDYQLRNSTQTSELRVGKEILLLNTKALPTHAEPKGGIRGDSFNITTHGPAITLEAPGSRLNVRAHEGQGNMRINVFHDIWLHLLQSGHGDTVTLRLWDDPDLGFLEISSPHERFLFHVAKIPGSQQETPVTPEASFEIECESLTRALSIVATVADEVWFKIGSNIRLIAETDSILYEHVIDHVADVENRIVGALPAKELLGICAVAKGSNLRVDVFKNAVGIPLYRSGSAKLDFKPNSLPPEPRNAEDLYTGERNRDFVTQFRQAVETVGVVEKEIRIQARDTGLLLFALTDGPVFARCQVPVFFDPDWSQAYYYRNSIGVRRRREDPTPVTFRTCREALQDALKLLPHGRVGITLQRTDKDMRLKLQVLDTTVWLIGVESDDDMRSVLAARGFRGARKVGATRG